MPAVIRATELRRFYAAFGEFIAAPQAEYDKRLADLIELHDALQTKSAEAA